MKVCSIVIIFLIGIVSVSAREYGLMDFDFDDNWPQQYAADFPRYLRSFTSSPSYTIESAPISSPVNKKFHLFHTLAENWHKAYHTCLTHGMRLASISSKDENNLLVETIKEAGVSGSFWISGTNLGNGPYIYWFGIDKPMTFNNWSKGEPNNASEDDVCIELNYDEDFKWNDAMCTNHRYFACEEVIDIVVHEM